MGSPQFIAHNDRAASMLQARKVSQPQRTTSRSLSHTQNTMAASQYTSSYPDNVPFDTKYRDFISEFYRISDTPDAHEKYSQQFTPDAHLVMASKEVDGTEGSQFKIPIIEDELTSEQKSWHSARACGRK